jgi:hypothetical protein
MCATVCPSGALAFMTPEDFARTRRGHAINEWAFGNEKVRTKVRVVVPPQVEQVRVDLVQISGLAPQPASTAIVDPEDVAAMLEEA